MKIKLTKQLFLIWVIVVVVIIMALGIILPNMLKPIYEENVYNYLKQPLFLISDDIDNSEISTEVAYVYVSGNYVRISDNLLEIIKVDDINELLNNIENNYGKFKYRGKYYYYYTSRTSGIVKIAVTNDKYINYVEEKKWGSIVLVIGIAFCLISCLLIWWSNLLVKRIKKIKNKVDNLDKDSYNEMVDVRFLDELYTLDSSINEMRVYLKQQDEYKNQMYQSISHDFKTPITVIKSYIEAVDDGIESPIEAMTVVSEQVNKLEKKVHSLLYLNKLNYIHDRNEGFNSVFPVKEVIVSSFDKFRNTRSDVEFVLEILDDEVLFRGTFDMWEAIIDNILGNFVRYADEMIKVSVSCKEIILFNDGEKINEKVINSIFTPYEKGVNGMFGFGLSIVKKTLDYLDYDVIVENVENGVKFVIKDRKCYSSVKELKNK